MAWQLKALRPDAIATRIRDAGLHQTGFGIQAITKRKACLASSNHTRPIGWSLESAFISEEADRERRDAGGLVQEFISGIHMNGC